MSSFHKGALALLAFAFTTPAWADGRAREARDVIAADIGTANAGARVDQAHARFEGARTIYDFQEGALYQIYTNPGFVSSILLQPGERLNDIAAGDTSRWLVTEAEGGSDGQTRAVVLIKPQSTGLRTNVVLITDRRTYVLEVVAEPHGLYSPEVAWSYHEQTASAPSSPTLENLDFDYRVHTVRGARPAWFPARVFDDGARTYVEFAPDVAAAELPPLFVVTADGAELVNYRLQAGRYMIDRVFDVAELRLGTRAQTIVRIERHPPPRARPLHRRVHP